MRWHAAVLGLAIAVAAVAPAAAASALDQEQAEATGSVRMASSDLLAQTVTAGLTGPLSRVSLLVGTFGSGETLTVELREVTAAGAPADEALASASATFATAVAAQWQEFRFRPAPVVAAGQRYALVLRESDSPAGGFTWHGTSDGARYAAGDAWWWFACCGWWPNTMTLDLAFRTYVGPDTTPTSTTLASSADPSVAGDPVTFTATVAPAEGTVAPSGAVGFARDGVAIAGCQAVALVAAAGGSASASCTLTDTAASGTYSIVAAYRGDAAFDASTSAPLAQRIKGVRELLDDLRAVARTLGLDPRSLARAMEEIDRLAAAVAAGDVERACDRLERGAGLLGRLRPTAATREAAALIASIARVLGCDDDGDHHRDRWRGGGD